MPKLESKPLTWLKPDPKQPRKHFDEAELRLLGESLRKKQLQPVLCQPDGTIVAGERRWRAAKLVALTTLEVKIADAPLSEAEARVWQLVENMQRADLSGFEQWTACAELMCMNPSWQMKDLADSLNLDPSTVTRILSPSKCIQEVQDALQAGKVTISDCYAISKLEKTKQAGLLALKLSGANREQLEQAGRRERAPKAEAVKVGRVKCALSSGVCITAVGDGLSLDGLIEALAEAHKEAKKAREQGLDAKTFQAVMRDKARAG